MSEFNYAEQFGIDPQTVRQTVTIKTWMRWMLLNKTRYAREIINAPIERRAKLSISEIEVMKWALDNKVIKKEFDAR